jgi:signal peptidase
VAGLVGSAYLITSLALPLLDISSFTRTYVLQPLMWALLVLAILALPRYRTSAKLRTRSTIRWLAFGIGFAQVAFYITGGLFSEFGRSANSFTLQGIVTNLVLVGSLLIGMELSRAWLVNQWGKHAILALFLVSLLYTVISIPLAQIRNLQANVETISFVGEVVLPALAESVLASVLAWLAGPLAAMAYRGPLLAFWWFCPILPNLPWALGALVGVGVPVAGIMLVSWLYFTRAGRLPGKRTRESGFPVGWVAIGVFTLVMVWFAVGLFPVQPRLISSGSMEPTIDVGDIAITAEVPIDTIRMGDIIGFRLGHRTVVVHRVVEIKEEGKSISFTTKGDANSDPDSDPVLPDNVVGKVVFVAPKIGWVGIAVKSLFV